MSGGLDAERWRLVELLQVRALKMFLSGPDLDADQWYDWLLNILLLEVRGT